METDLDNISLGSMGADFLESRKRRSIWLRVIVVTIGLVFEVLVRPEHPALWGALIVYWVIAAVAAGLYFRKVLREEIRSPVFVVIDLLMVLYLIYGVGAETSPMVVLLVLIVTIATVQHGRKFNLIIVGTAVGGYGLLLALQATKILPPAPFLEGTGYAPKGLAAFGVVATALVSAAYTQIVIVRRIERQTEVERQLLVSRLEAERHNQRLELKLEETARLEGLGRLAGGIAHDFNNLLTVILGYTALVHEGMHPDQEQRAVLGEVLAAARRGRDLTGQLLSFCRKQPVELQPVEVDGRLRDLMRMLEHVIGEDVALELQLDASPYLILADGARIDQCIMNLVVNARDAMPKGGRLVLRTTLEERAMTDMPLAPHVRIDVIDNGEGMDATTLSKVYEPFFTTKERGKGTGLGLATVYGIVTQLGGQIEAVSELGHGSTFSLFFPVAEGLTLSDAGTRRDGGHPTSAGTVLLVEDQALVRQMTAMLLTQLGYRVVPAHSGEAALLLVADLHTVPDLLLTDVIMPGMTGQELVETLESRGYDLPTVFMSGYTDDIIDHHGVRTGEVHFLAKPFDKGELAVALAKALGASARKIASV